MSNGERPVSDPLPFGVTQEDIDRAARTLAELGYDVGDRPAVDGVGVSPNLRMATYLALKSAESAAKEGER